MMFMFLIRLLPMVRQLANRRSGFQLRFTDDRTATIWKLNYLIVRETRLRQHEWEGG